MTEIRISLDEVQVFNDVVAFSEALDFPTAGSAKRIKTYPFTDERAIDLLLEEHIANVNIRTADGLSDERCKAFTDKLETAGIGYIYAKLRE